MVRNSMSGTGIGALMMILGIGCGQSTEDSSESVTNLDQPAGEVVSEQRGQTHESAGGSETEVITALRVGDEVHTIEGTDRLEAVAGQQRSQATLIDRNRGISRRFVLDDAASRLGVYQGGAGIDLAIGSGGAIFVNGRPVRDENEAMQLIYANAVVGGASPHLLIAAENRLARSPQHLGGVGRAIKRLGQVVLRGAACRMMTGSWRCDLGR